MVTRELDETHRDKKAFKGLVAGLLKEIEVLLDIVRH